MRRIRSLPGRDGRSVIAVLPGRLLTGALLTLAGGAFGVRALVNADDRPASVLWPSGLAIAFVAAVLLAEQGRLHDPVRDASPGPAGLRPDPGLRGLVSWETAVFLTAGAGGLVIAVLLSEEGDDSSVGAARYRGGLLGAGPGALLSALWLRRFERRAGERVLQARLGATPAPTPPAEDLDRARRTMMSGGRLSADERQALAKAEARVGTAATAQEEVVRYVVVDRRGAERLWAELEDRVPASVPARDTRIAPAVAWLAAIGVVVLGSPRASSCARADHHAPSTAWNLPRPPGAPRLPARRPRGRRPGGEPAGGRRGSRVAHGHDARRPARREPRARQGRPPAGSGRAAGAFRG